MPRPSTTLLERLFEACSEIGFHVTEDYEKHPPVIMLGFSKGEDGARAYNALLDWAMNDEIVATLYNRKTHIDVALIHVKRTEIVNVKRLSFDDIDFADFVSKEPQTRRLALIPCTNPVKENGMIMSRVDFSPLVLDRYTVVN